MLAQEFINTIGREAPPALVLLCPYKAPKARDYTWEPYLAEQVIERLMAQYVDPSLRDLSYSAFYAEETKADKIALEAQTLPFLAERRVILVRNAHVYNVEGHVKHLLDYLQSPCDTCLLILVASELDRRSKFYKACEKTAHIVECGELSPAEMTRWIVSESEKRGKKIRSDAAEEIYRRAGKQLGPVNNALNVVLGFAASEDTITLKHVVTACADVAEEEVGALTDAISNSDTSRSLESLRRLLDLGTEPEELLGKINWLLKTAYLIQVGKAVPPAVHPYVAQKVRPLATKLGEKVRNAMMLATDAQFNMRSTGTIPELCIELLVLRLAAPMPQKTARRKID